MQRYTLKFLWLERTIGVSLDQYTSKGESILLTDFYFWPQVDAWEKIKIFLEQSPFISQNEAVIILNQITEVINFWQEKNLKDLDSVREKFPNVRFLGS